MVRKIIRWNLKRFIFLLWVVPLTILSVTTLVSKTTIQEGREICNKSISFPSSHQKPPSIKNDPRKYISQESNRNLFSLAKFILNHGNLSIASDVNSWPFHPYEIAQANLFHQLQIKRNQITAILVSWKRIKNVKFIVNYLCQFPHVTEIIVWNNFADVALTLSDFVATEKSIVIVNSYQNHGVRARYLAALLASNPTVFFQDDDWDTRGYFNALYQAFLASPSQVHIATELSQQGINLLHTYNNRQINLHTGFAWIGCGCFASTLLVRQFFEVTKRHNGGSAAEIHLDCLFTLFTNQFPMVYVVKLRPVGGPKEKAVAILNRESTKVEINRLTDYARRTLVAALLHGDAIVNADESDLAFSTLINRTLDEQQRFWTISSDGGCLFGSNMATVDLASQTYGPNNHTFNPELRRQFKDSVEYFKRHPYFCAVNEMENTHLSDGDCCWKSRSKAQLGDYFGYDFLAVGAIGRLVIKHGMPEKWISFGRLELSLEGIKWMEFKGFNVAHIKSDLSAVSQLILDFRSESNSYGVVTRFVRFIFNETLDEFVTLCGLIRKF